jgi:hypothetical protein
LLDGEKWMGFIFVCKCLHVFLKLSIATLHSIYHSLQNICLLEFFHLWSHWEFVWKINRSSRNKNTLIQNEGCETFFNEAKFEDEAMEETQGNASMQTQGSTIPNNTEKKLSKIWNYCILKEKKWKLHNKLPYVDLFMCEIMQKLHLMHFKSCIDLVLF